jgi:hypothetical protein
VGKCGKIGDESSLGVCWGELVKSAQQMAKLHLDIKEQLEDQLKNKVDQFKREFYPRSVPTMHRSFVVLLACDLLVLGSFLLLVIF